MGGGASSLSGFFNNDKHRRTLNQRGRPKFSSFSEFDEGALRRFGKIYRVRETYLPYLMKQNRRKGRRRSAVVKSRASRPKIPLRRSNSMNTFHLSSVMISLDHYALLISVSAIMHSRLKKWIPNYGKGTSKQHLNCFIDRFPTPASGAPSFKDFQSFLTFMYRGAQLEPEVLILGLIYYERILKMSRGVLRACRLTWRPLVLISLILGSKMYDDLSMINADFETVTKSHFPLQMINRMELVVVLLLNFDLNITQAEYTKYYFNVRALLGPDLIRVSPQTNFGVTEAMMNQDVGTYEELKDREQLESVRSRRTYTFATNGEFDSIAQSGRPTSINLERIVASWHASAPRWEFSH